MKVSPPTTTAKAILHPIRAQILIALSDRKLIARELSELIEEVPLGTLYRHLNILLDAGLICVAEERRVQGVIERRFALVESAQYVNREELSADDILGLVTALTGAVQTSFGQYVRHANLPPAEGEISILVKSLYLSDDEYGEIRKVIYSALTKTGREPSEHLHRRMLAFFSAPELETKKTEEVP